jgi:hypothetical protein
MIRTKKIETIFVEPTKRKALCEALSINKSTFYAAVNGYSNSELAARIRREALSDYDGVKIKKTIVLTDN